MNEKALDFEDDFAQEEFSVTDPKALGRVAFVYNTMKNIIRGSRIKVSYELNQPFTDMGRVSIIGREIIITDPSQFVKASGFASNMTILPEKNDLTVGIDFIFNDLTRKIGE